MTVQNIIKNCLPISITICTGQISMNTSHEDPHAVIFLFNANACLHHCSLRIYNFIRLCSYAVGRTKGEHKLPAAPHLWIR
jgi:hypothetical protein